MKHLAAAILSLAALSGGMAQAQTYAPPAPPADLGAPPPPPGPAAGYYLTPGHYQWTGARYVWVQPVWIPRAVGYTSYVPGHWAVGRFGRWHWIPGHWVR